MTTIAYRDGVLAADTLRTAGNNRDGHCHKIKQIGRVLVAFAGSTAIGEAFKDWVASGMNGPSPVQGSEEGNGLIVAPGGVLLCFGKHGPWRVEGTDYYSLGSGQDIALGAMGFGASAAEAVKVAMQFDTASGGEIQVVAVPA